MNRRQYLGSVAGIGAASVLGTTAVGASSAAELGTIADPEGDDTGPGSYTYPTTDQLPEGCFDVLGVTVNDTETHWELTYEMGAIPNSFGSDAGFSVQVFQIYIRDPNAPDDAVETVTGREGTVSTFQEAYQYRAHVTGFSQLLETPGTEESDPEVLADGFPASANSEDSTITISLPKEHFQTTDFNELKLAMLVFSQDGFGTGGIRQNLGETAGDWRIGGANPDAISNAPRAMELVGPDNVVKQSESLAYSADAAPSVPLVKGEYLLSGELPSTGVPTALVDPGPTVFAGMDATLNASNSSDPDEQELTYAWTQTAGPSAEISGSETANPTVTTPEVDSESTLTFEVTVTDTDGNSASATTDVTVRPQSANDAPIANAGSDKTVSPGQGVPLQGVGSEDPNGGTLSFQWTQTAGPEVDLSSPETAAPAFTAPDVDSTTTLTFELTVSDGQGKSATDTVDVTVEVESASTTTSEMGDETTEMADDTTEMGGDDTTEESDSGSGTGPGFGAISALVGVAGGAAYAGKRFVSGESDEE